jgi:hypothetical protein
VPRVLVVHAATKVIRARTVRREQRARMALRVPKGSQDTPATPATPAPLDTAARAVRVPKVILVHKVPKAQKAPKGFKVVPDKLE